MQVVDVPQKFHCKMSFDTFAEFSSFYPNLPNGKDWIEATYYDECDE